MKGYGGTKPELYTVIANNVLGAGSSEFESISIIEEDSYGRVLFFYAGNYSNIYQKKLRIISICQKSDNKYAYYYEDDCFFVCEDFEASLSISEILPLVQDELEELKNLNDWNQELNESKMTSAKIVKNFTQKLEYHDDSQHYKTALSSVKCSEGYSWDYYIMCSDKFGRQLILMQENPNDATVSNQLEDVRTFLVIVPNSGYVSKKSVLELTAEQLYDYRDIIKDFKESNNWNKE